MWGEGVYQYSVFQKRLVSWAKRRGTVYKSSEESCLVSLFFGKTFYKKGGRTIGSWLFFFFLLLGSKLLVVLVGIRGFFYSNYLVFLLWGFSEWLGCR